ncbi:MAG: fibrinogen-like YCDxxxxGGGW domain-containing protein [Polyangiaceae bacterium]
MTFSPPAPPRALRRLAALWSILGSWACVHGEASLLECPAGQEACELACVDLSVDPDNCGFCGTTCAADEICAKGVCGPDCGDLARCGDGCADVRSDTDHCGGCDRPCEAGEVCEAGLCQLPGACNPACDPDESCYEGSCYPSSCRAILDADPGATSGLYQVDPDGEGGEPPFEVACNMSEDGGGWFELAIDDSQGLLMAQNAATNGWTKCDDDSAKWFEWITETEVTADAESSTNMVFDIPLGYVNPTTSIPFSEAQLDALRGAISELSTTTRMVAVTADDDNLDWSRDMMGGHEVYVQGASLGYTLLTPGTNGDCGGAGVTTPGSEAAFYRWHQTAAASQVSGVTGITSADLTGLGIGDLVPKAVRLVVATGGGVAFGYAQPVFLVR